MWINRNKNIIPVRYPKMEIKQDSLKNFFKLCGKYPGVDKTDSEISKVWQSVFDQYATDVFDLMEKGDLIQLKKNYENYYIHGTSEGASSGKALSKNRIKLAKAKRNVERVKPLQEYLGLKSLQSEKFLNASDFYTKINENVVIPESINVGQPWGWYYNEFFVHFELADYLYFSDIILKLLDLLKINRTYFLGDGSGLLSSLVYYNSSIEISLHVDLGHFLIKQFLTNEKFNTNITYNYAENFNSKAKINSQILINQDSFPEMKKESVEKYVSNIQYNKVPYLLSYNHEVVDFRHSDFRSIILSYGYKSKLRICSSVRTGYIIELFELQ
jgi:hypothetical protein